MSQCNRCIVADVVNCLKTLPGSGTGKALKSALACTPGSNMLTPVELVVLLQGEEGRINLEPLRPWNALWPPVLG